MNLDRRKHLPVLSAPLFDDVVGTQFGSLVGYVTKRDIVDLELVSSAIVTRAQVHRPLVNLLGSLLSSALSVDRNATNQKRLQLRNGARGRDALTGLYDRSSWLNLLEVESAALTRYADSACLMLIDVVGLTRLNASHGHPAGDGALRALADSLRRATEGYDIAARLRSCEFAMLLLGDHAEARALQVEAALSALPVAVRCGIADHTNASVNFSGTMARADAAMTTGARSGNDELVSSHHVQIGLFVEQPRPQAQRSHAPTVVFTPS